MMNIIRTIHNTIIFVNLPSVMDYLVCTAAEYCPWKNEKNLNQDMYIHSNRLSINLLLVLTDACVSYEDLCNITTPFLSWQCFLNKRQKITTLTCHIRVTNLQPLQALLSYIALAYYLKLANTNYVNVDLLQHFCSSGTDKEVQRMLNKLWYTDNSNTYKWKSRLQLVGRKVLANMYFKIRLNDYWVQT